MKPLDAPMRPAGPALAAGRARGDEEAPQRRAVEAGVMAAGLPGPLRRLGLD